MSGISRRRFLAGSVLAGLMGWTPLTRARASTSLPWRNWSGGQVAYPAGRLSPSNLDELVSMVKATSGTLRPVGSGHSFSALVPTDGHLVVIDQLAGLLDHDDEALTATLGAGTRLGDIGSPLEAIGQAMFNLPDIDRQTLAGATATATHGTGRAFTSLSGYIRALQLVTPRGDVVEIDRDKQPDLYAAAAVNLGALGVVTRVTLQNRDTYRLKARTWTQPIEEVLEGFDKAAASHRHYEMFPLTHSDYAAVLATDETDEPIDNPPQTVEEAAAFDNAMKAWMMLPPIARKPVINGLAQMTDPSEIVDVSYRVLSHVRMTRFNEMEYSVPHDAGPECVREILRTIEEKEIDVVFPLEYRYVKRDDTWLSMSSGAQDHVAISVHRIATEDYRPYFREIEPIFWKYEGRPHWGKLHTLTHKELTRLYPHFEDFLSVRAEYDPGGRMLNDHLRTLFGVST